MPDRRDQILEAANSLMHSGGLKAVTVRAVAAEAGIGASTLRHYFRSQTDLHEALVRTDVRSRIRDLRIHDANLPAEERLVECLVQFLPKDREEVLAAADSWQVLLERIRDIDPDATGTSIVRWLADEGTGTIREWLTVLEGEGVKLPGSADEVAQMLGTHCDGLLASLMLDPRFTTDAARAQLAALVGIVLS